MPDDLNERVQARLTELDRVLVDPLPDNDLANAFRHFPSVGLILIVSWRERWERHRPIAGLCSPGGVFLENPYCIVCTDAPDGLCPDALSVLYEIGVEP